MLRSKPAGRKAQTVARPAEPIRLPRPAPRLGTSLVRALQLRRTTREIGSRKLPRQTLSDLLWAGCGVNRRKGPFGIPGRTAASASNSQEVDVYQRVLFGQTIG
jgi:hypothetical protein